MIDPRFIKQAEELIVESYRGDLTMRPYPPLANAIAQALQDAWNAGSSHGWEEAVDLAKEGHLEL